MHQTRSFIKASPVVTQSLQTAELELSWQQILNTTNVRQLRVSAARAESKIIKPNCWKAPTLLAQDSRIQEKLPGFCAGPAEVELFLFFPVSMLGEEVVGLSFSAFEWEE